MRCRLANRGLAPPALLGLAHLVVDASSGLVLGRWLPEIDPARVVLWFVVYDACAFALQPLFGALSDRLARPRALALAGLAVVLGALFLPPAPPWLPLVAVGVGNAVFHVGGGVLAATATPERAAGSGVFIGPGALGVLIGTLAGTAVEPLVWPFAAALAASLVVVALLAEGPGAWPAPPARDSASGGRTAPAAAVALLLLGAIAIRAFVGFAAASGIAGAAHAGVVLAVAAFAGKSAGGLVADRWGWTRTSLVALAAAAVLFLVAGDSLAVAAAGVVLFQVVTGVTLAALYGVWPRGLGLSFGLACLALLLGSFPFIVGWEADTPALTAPPLVASLTLVAAAAIAAALALLTRLGVSPALARRIGAAPGPHRPRRVSARRMGRAPAR